MDTSLFFQDYFGNAEVNSMLILDTKGLVMDLNHSFTNNFGYGVDDLRGRHFEILFNDQDRKDQKPAKELLNVNSIGQSDDENYVVNSRGEEIWCLGESVLVNSHKGEKFIVKDIVNLHSGKQFEIFLTDTDELLRRIFDHSEKIPMVILSGNLKIINVNRAFRSLFDLDDISYSGKRLSDLDNPFWKENEIKDALYDVVVSNVPMKQRTFHLTGAPGNQLVRIDSKIIGPEASGSKKIYLIFYPTNV